MALPLTRGVRSPDMAARSLARTLLSQSRHGALGTLLRADADAPPVPVVTRVAVVPGENGWPLLLISALSLHAAALRADPALSLLLGDVTAKGDPLTQPRLTLLGHARFLTMIEMVERDALRTLWLSHQPKARPYVDLPDFSFVAVDVAEAFLNGGFGLAYHLGIDDLK